MYDVIILGSGPAGLTAAIYTQRFGLSTVVVAGRRWGGQLMLTSDVENYPGFAKIQGPELMQKMRDQAQGLGVEIIDKDFTELSVDTGNQAIKQYQDLQDLRNPKKPFVVTAEDITLEGKTVIVATGADTRWLGVPGEERLRGHGVSSCAPCDAFFFRGKPVAVVGGGDSAMEETQVIANVSSDVIVIHRGPELRAQKAMIDKVKATSKVRFLYNTRILKVLGETSVTGLLLETTGVDAPQELVATYGGTLQSVGQSSERPKNASKSIQWVLSRQGVFVAIGLDPNTKHFQGVELDSHGYVKRHEEHDENGVVKYFTKSSVPGVFTAGDVHDSRYKQAITAAAFGCMAALDVQRWLVEQG